MDDEDWAALDALIGGFKARISADPDDEKAYRDMSRLTETLRQETTACAEIRSIKVARIRDRGDLSLAKLGDRIGVSKARAAEMIEAERRRKTR